MSASRARWTTSPPRRTPGTWAQSRRGPRPRGTSSSARSGSAAAPPLQQATFYTALYHASLEPSLFNDANGQYIGFDDKVHRVATGARSVCELLRLGHLPVPGAAAGHHRPRQSPPTWRPRCSTTRLRAAALPKWPIANGYTGVMNGDAADPILADTYAFGARGFDAASRPRRHGQGRQRHPRPSARAGLRRAPERSGLHQKRVRAEHRLRLDQPGAQRRLRDPRIRPRRLLHLAARRRDLGAALDRRDVRRPLAELGEHLRHRRRLRRAARRRRRLPLRAAGARLTGFGQDGFQEGNAAQYTWMVPQNLKGLVQGHGRRRRPRPPVSTRYFTQLNAGPERAVPVGRATSPRSTRRGRTTASASRGRRSRSCGRSLTQLYSLTPGGEPGNDDLGAMSSWYVWAALGCTRRPRACRCWCWAHRSSRTP